jgi:hypothetical protein
MRLKLPFYKFAFLLVLLGLLRTDVSAQVTEIIPATGTAGSYITGSVDPTGIKHDGFIDSIGNGLTPGFYRGWATFDLSTIPIGATIASVDVVFATTPPIWQSGAVNFLGGFGWSAANDPATMSGATLFTLLNADAFTNIDNGSSWPALDTSIVTRPMNAAGLALVTNNIGGKVVVSFNRGGTNRYFIAGYDVSNPAYMPQLVINYTLSTPCGGLPPGGTANSSSVNPCANVPFTLSLTGGPVTTGGITYQWQESPIGAGTFTNIPNATDLVYVMSSGISAAMDYQMVVTCANGGGVGVSTPITVNVNSFMNCYCEGRPNNNTEDDIFNVTVGSLSNSSTCATVGPPPTSLGNIYSNYMSTITPPQLGQGTSVPFSVEIGNCSGNSSSLTSTAIYIDLDQNGSFSDPGEQVYLSAVQGVGPHTESGMIAIPPTASIGTTGMRVIMLNGVLPINMAPCGITTPYGETEDYVVDIVVPAACSGTPVAGTATASLPAICPGGSFTLNASGFSSGVSGLTFQWQESPAGAGTFIDIAGATDPFYNMTTQSANADYHVVVTCSNGGGLATSNDVTVTMNPFFNCYCTAIAAFTGDEEIINVTVGPLNNSSTCATTGGPGSVLNRYSDYSTLLPVTPLAQGDNVAFSIGVTECQGNSYNNGTAIFIDYDQNGLFTDPGEQVWTSTSMAYGPNTIMGSFLVPATAATGTTRMRVMAVESYFGIDITPCMVYNYGETEDYLVEIVVPTACTGTPAPGTASSNFSSVCSSQSYTLSTSGYTTGQSGIILQWQESPSGAGTWTDVPGANSPFYSNSGLTSATDYRMMITCSNGGGVDYSNEVTVSASLFYSCYCSPITGTTLHTLSQNYVNNVAIAGTTLNSSNVILGPGGYTQTNPAIASNTANLTPLAPYTMNVTMYGTGTFYSANVWIDYDQSGTFDASEYTLLDPAGPGAVSSGVLSVPVTALSGPTGMRVRVNYTNYTAGQACYDAFFYGETEDYMVTIDPLTGCLPPLTLGASNVTSTTADVSWDPVAGASGYEYVVDQNAGNPAGSGTPTTNTLEPVGGLSPASVHYLHVRTDCGAGGFSPWTSNDFTTTPENNLCADAVDISSTFVVPGSTVGGTESMPPGSCAPTTLVANDVWYYFTLPTSGDVTVTATNTSGDLVLEILSGTCGAFTEIDCQDIPAIGTETSVLTGLAAGTYYARVYGFLGSQTSFNIQVTGAPLAIKLHQISAENIGRRNRISWNTASEDKGDYFIVEKSTDASVFTEIGKVAGNGQASTYSFWDENPVSGVNYYRLKLLSANGATGYSRTVSATVKDGLSFTVDAYPNPVANQLTVKTYGQQGDNAMVSICDVTGRVIRIVALNGDKASINMSQMASGVYLIKYSDSDHSQTIKVNKQ